VQTGVLSLDDTPSRSDLPDGGAWRPIRTGLDGLVNLSTQLGSPGGSRAAVAWLRTRIYSSVAQTRRVSIGWVRQVSVFADGKRVYTDQNLFGTPSKRKTPGGRVSLDNGSFDLHLRKGFTTVVVGVGNRQKDHASRYGWGVMLHLNQAVS
jgi:hypothetical protein